MIKPIEIDMVKKKKRKPILLVILLVFVLLIAIVAGAGYFLIYQPAMRIKTAANTLVASSKDMKEIVAKNDIDLLKTKLEKVSGEYTQLEKEAESLYWADFIPHVQDLRSGVEAGRYVIKAGQETVEAIYPYADLIGFKQGQASFVERSAEDRLQTAVATLDKMLSKIDVIAEDIHQAEKRINTIDPNRYPEKVGDTEVRAMLVNVKDQFEGMASLFVTAKPFVKNLPAILGKDKEMTYLIFFQNDKEQRATGGFLTAYAVFKIKEGKISIVKSENIYDLDNTIRHPKAPEKILQYHIDVPEFNIRDSNLSPDFVESIKLFESLYAKSPAKVDYDGIIAIDTNILVDMLNIFGDTEAGGVRFSAEKDKRCDCPQVIYALSYTVGRRTGYVRENRKAVLGELVNALFYKAIGFSPSKYWGTLAQTMFKNMEEKHILMYFKNPSIQEAVEKLNYAGRIREYDGDYLHVNNVNFAGAKSNLFTSKILTSKTEFQSDGSVKREIEVEFSNPYPASNCSLELENGLCLNAPLRNWIRVYVPKDSQLVDFKGSQKKTMTYDEIGKTVFEGFLVINPQSKSKVVVTYTLPKSITKDNYSVMIQKQPGESDMKLKVEIDGETKFDGVMAKDFENK